MNTRPVGSVGLLKLHVDKSGALKKSGVKPTFIVSRQSPRKVDGNPFEPLSDRARNTNQRKVDDTARQFVAAVARGRGVDPATVERNYGRGDTMMVAEAQSAGMIDGIGTLEDLLLSRSSRSLSRQTGGRALTPCGARPPA